jgi:type IV secretion system protein TrbE
MPSSPSRSSRWLEIIARAIPKRDYYCQSRRGNRLFELGLGEVALAFTAASSKSDQTAIARMLAEQGRNGFAAGWLRHKGLDWAAGLLSPKHDQPQELTQSDLEMTS